MRIFQVIESNANTLVQKNATWYRNLHEPLVEMGHDVVLFSAEDGRKAMDRVSARLRAAFSQRLLDAFRREHTRKPFQLFFSYLMDGMIETAALDEIRKTGVPTCNFSCNNAHQFYLVDELSPHFDFNLHAEKDARDKFLAIGANPLWWPMASNPAYFKPERVARTIDASFVGAAYALRPRYVRYLLDNGIGVHVFGPGWRDAEDRPLLFNAKRWYYGLTALCSPSPQTQSKHSARMNELAYGRLLNERFPDNMHGTVSDDELIALYSKSHICLGFLEAFENHDLNATMKKHIHLREFEAPMCGAFYMTGYLDELFEFFEPDREIVVYRDQEELLDKARYYLSHPDAAEQIRAAGHQRALRDHTYQARYKQLFRALHLMT